MSGGKLTQMAEDIVEKMDSYTEISPSGMGVRIVCKASYLSYDTDRYYINKQTEQRDAYIDGLAFGIRTISEAFLHENKNRIW